MSKLVSLLLLVVIIFSEFTFRIPAVQAANCTFSLEDESNPGVSVSPNRDMGNLRVNIASTNLADGTYNLAERRPNSAGLVDYGHISFKSGAASSVVNKPTGTGWLPGKHELFIIKLGTSLQSENAECSQSFTIADNPSATCTTKITSKPIDPSTGVVLHIENIPESNEAFPGGAGGYDIYINDQINPNAGSRIYNTKAGPDIVLGNFPSGSYVVSLKTRCGFVGLSCAGKPPRLVCPSAGFQVADFGSGGGGPVGVEPGSVPKAACKPGDLNCAKAGGIACDTGTKGEQGILTAIGCVPSQPQPLVEGLVKFITFGSGGIALLLMIFASFRYITSAGNPDSVKAAWDQFQNAFIGLLFILFSVLLLQIIGVDILGIPGLTS